MANETEVVASARREDEHNGIEHSSNDRSMVVHPHGRPTAFSRFFRYPAIAAGFALLFSWFTVLPPGYGPVDPTNYAERTKRILETTPLIDGHNDLPWLLRIELHNRIYDGKADFTKRLLGHTDLQRMRQGMMGGQFWSVYVKCDAQQQHFEDPSLCDTAACARKAFASGRIASMIGIEGGHQVGGSIAGIRQMYELGARYITLTHNCDNAFGTATTTVADGGYDEGLLKLGYGAVKEMNRLGMIVDLSHVSHQTMRDAISVARAPVVFSHSGAYSVSQHLRNVPDDVLRSLKQNGGIVMVVFVNRFVRVEDPESANVHDVVDHILHIAEVCGWDCVGIGGDFSGTGFVPKGLEDVSKYPSLVEALLERGATDDQVRLLVGENILRVWRNIELRAQDIQASGERPVEEEYEGRVWHKGLKNDPYMLRGSRERMVKVDSADRGIQGPAIKNV